MPSAAPNIKEKGYLNRFNYHLVNPELTWFFKRKQIEEIRQTSAAGYCAAVKFRLASALSLKG